LKDEKNKVEDMNEELEEIKERLMAERRRIFEESEKSNFDQGDLSLKIHELKTREEVLN
jgi:DNA gyrase/topoisomerase IV subunit A